MVPVQLPKAFTHGDVLRWRRVGGLTLAEVQYAAGQRVHRHIHPHARFVLLLSGGITEIRGDDTQTYGPSTLLFRRGDEPHAYMVGRTGATCLIVDVDEEWQARARLHAPVLEQSAAFRGGFVLHLAHRLYGEFRLRDEVSRLAIESITLGVLAEASRRAAQATERPAPSWLQQARALVDTHFSKPLPLVEVARRVGVHPVHLARTFRRVHRITFAGYVRHVRIEFARRELEASVTPLGDIAVAAGFCDQSHFSRLFKRYTGQTPAEYRLAFQTR
jgi:AraC family transcriptional regulator